jgi:hypothetical protein
MPSLLRPFYRLIDTNAYLRMIIRSLNRKQQNASRARLGLRYNPILWHML